MSYSMSIRSRAREHVGGRRRRRRAHQHAALHVRRDAEAGEREHGRREIDEADQLVAHRAGAATAAEPRRQPIISGTRRPES